MFWTIPSQKSEIITNSPIGAKSIRYLFFENKNNGLFQYKQIPDTITISVDGKVICRDLFILPFCSTSPDGLNRFAWKDIALSINMNIDNSDIHISGLRSNDFNVVFVCSEKSVDESGGFDFFETKFLSLKRTASVTTRRSNTPLFPLRPLRGGFSKIDLVVDRPVSVQENTEGQEMNLSFDHEPKFFFCYPYISDINSKIKNYKIHANFDVTGGDNELIPNATDIEIISANEKIGFRDAMYFFDESSKKNLLLTIRQNNPSALADNVTILNADIVFCFGYKKIN